MKKFLLVCSLLMAFGLTSFAASSTAYDISVVESNDFTSVGTIVTEAPVAKTFRIVMMVLFVAGISQTLRIKSFGLRAYFDSVQELPFTPAQKVLWDFLVNSEDADVNTKQALLKKQLSINTYHESLKFQIAVSATGKIEVLNATTVYRQGRMPLEYNQGFLPKGFNMAWSHIRMGYGTDAVLLPEAITNYTTVPAGWPAALQHGQIIFSQNNAVSEQFSCRALGSAAASVNNGVEGDGLELQTPILWQEGKPMKIEIFTPTGVAFPATPAILAVSLDVMGAVVRPRA